VFACCCCCPLSRDTKAANGVAFRRWRQEVRAAGQPAWARQGGRYHRLETHGQERQCWRQGMPCGVSMKPAANLQLTTGTCSPPLAARLAARSAQPMVRTASLSTGRVHQCDKLAVRPLQAGAQQYQHPCNPSLQQHEKRSTSHPVAGHRQVDTRSSPVHSPLQHAPHLRGDKAHGAALAVQGRGRARRKGCWACACQRDCNDVPWQACPAVCQQHLLPRQSQPVRTGQDAEEAPSRQHAVLDSCQSTVLGSAHSPAVLAAA